MKKTNGVLKIESGVPMPEIGNFTEIVNTMRAMKVGDSFLCPVTKRTGLVRASREAAIKIITRAQDAEHVRVWRKND